MRRPDMKTPEQNEPPATPAEEPPGPMRPMRPEHFDASYAGTPPWDIGRPQPAFLALAEAGTIRGRVLDVGCGTGEHALMAASMGPQAEQASVGQSMENKKIVDLPLNGRDFVQLVALTPGATVAGTTYETQSSNVLINGQRSTKTTSTIDGVMNVDQLFQGFPISPSIDAIEEFRVQSRNFSAEQGMG